MSELIFTFLAGIVLLGAVAALLGTLQYRSDRELRRLQLRILDAWRSSMKEWRRAHYENMAFHRHYSSAVRAILERVDER